MFSIPEEFLKYVPLAALCISLLALFVSCANVGWSIYKEISLRGRVRVSFGYRQIFHETFPKPLERIIVSAVNHGPGSVKISNVVWRKASLWQKVTRRTEYGVIIYDYTDRMSGRLPHKVDVGEGIDLVLGPADKDIIPDDFTHVGVSDTFGRSHWAPKRDLRDFRKCMKERKKS